MENRTVFSAATGAGVLILSFGAMLVGVGILAAMFADSALQLSSVGLVAGGVALAAVGCRLVKPALQINRQRRMAERLERTEQTLTALGWRQEPYKMFVMLLESFGYDKIGDAFGKATASFKMGPGIAHTVPRDTVCLLSLLRCALISPGLSAEFLSARLIRGDLEDEESFLTFVSAQAGTGTMTLKHFLKAKSVKDICQFRDRQGAKFEISAIGSSHCPKCDARLCRARAAVRAGRGQCQYYSCLEEGHIRLAVKRVLGFQIKS